MKPIQCVPAALLTARQQKGLAMVEFAIGAPLLLLLLLAIGEFGRMLSHYNLLLQGTRDAARFVASQAMNATLGRIELDGSLQATARNLVVYGAPAQAGRTAILPGLTTGMVQVTATNAEHVQVSVTYTFRPVVGNALPGFFGERIPLNVALTATTVMRAL